MSHTAGDLSELQAVVGALAGKENAAEDAQAMVSVGALLEVSGAGFARGQATCNRRGFGSRSEKVLTGR